jgi:asparagine synthase (glutamine-hydrolysing)
MRSTLFKNNELLITEISQKIVDKYFKNFTFQDILFKMSYTDLKLALPDDMLTKVDKMTMLNSLEARTPFLDYRLVEYAFNIPSEFKLKGTNGKYILKDTFKDLLPKEIINKQKSGFGVPIGEWFKKELNPLLNETLSDSNLRKHELFNYKYIRSLIDLHISGKQDLTPQIWSLFVFQMWYDIYMS